MYILNERGFSVESSLQRISSKFLLWKPSVFSTCSLHQMYRRLTSRAVHNFGTYFGEHHAGSIFRPLGGIWAIVSGGCGISAK